MSLFDAVSAPGSTAPSTAEQREEKRTRTREEIAQAIARVQAEIRRRTWLDDPVAWARDRMGLELWSGQAEIMRSVRDHRRTAAQSCHEVGKSFSAALVCCWWLDCHPPGQAFVVTTAPTNPQVRAILWREIGRMHASAGLRGRVNQTEWHLGMPAGNEELVAFGRKPDDYDPSAFQGIHARAVLVVVDESCGVRGPLWDAADSLIANDDSKILEIGNPDDPTAEFSAHCSPGSGYNVVRIGAFDTPNFTGEPMPQHVLSQLIGKVWVEEKRRKWAPHWFWVNAKGQRVETIQGEPVPAEAVRVVPPEGSDPQATNPLWQSKVLGIFPKQGDSGSLIPIEWVIAAQNRELQGTGRKKIGVDVGGGGDASVGCGVDGPVARVLWEDHNPDTMETCGNAIAHARAFDCDQVCVDSIGIGRGVADRAKEIKREEDAKKNGDRVATFLAVNVGEAAYDPESFFNLRAELWWRLREKFERGEIDIDPIDDDLAAELLDIRYSRTSSGKIKIESKDEYKKRTKGRSPNRAESLMLAMAEPRLDGALDGKLTWGKRARRG